jgi:hypothetical protein
MFMRVRHHLPGGSDRTDELRRHIHTQKENEREEEVKNENSTTVPDASIPSFQYTQHLLQEEEAVFQSSSSPSSLHSKSTFSSLFHLPARNCKRELPFKDSRCSVSLCSVPKCIQKSDLSLCIR